MPEKVESPILNVRLTLKDRPEGKKIFVEACKKNRYHPSDVCRWLTDAWLLYLKEHEGNPPDFPVRLVPFQEAMGGQK